MELASKSNIKGRKPPVRQDSASRDSQSIVIEVALNEFARREYGRVTTSHIAKQAGISHRLLLKTYRTKENLWRTAIGSEISKLRRDMDVSVRSIEVKNPVGAAARAIYSFVVSAERHPSVTRIISNEIARETARSRWLFARHVEPIYDSIDRTFDLLRRQNDVSVRWHRTLLTSLIQFSANLVAPLGGVARREPWSQEELVRSAEDVATLIIGMSLPDIGSCEKGTSREFVEFSRLEETDSSFLPTIKKRIEEIQTGTAEYIDWRKLSN